MTKFPKKADNALGDLFGDERQTATSTPTKDLRQKNGKTTKPAPAAQPATRFLDIKQVTQRYRVSPATIWRWVVAKDKSFPKPIKLSKGTSRWLESHLLEFEDRASRAENEVAPCPTAATRRGVTQ